MRKLGIMKYTIEYREKEGYILLQVEGDQFGEHMEHALHLAVVLARDKHLHKFLVDMSKSNVKDSFVETYFFSTTMENTGVRKSDRIAAIYNSQPKQHLFYETVAQNQGWILKFFQEREKAMQWLAEELH